MASKWKYADMDYRQRLGLIEKGNKAVFDEEIARTKEIVKARRELGLDTSAQEKWIDEVGFNYAKSTAGEGDRISESGYAKLYLEDKPKDTVPSGVKSYRENGFNGKAYISGAKRKIEKAGELAKSRAVEKSEEAKRRTEDELYAEYPNLREAVINSGGNPDGGKMKSAGAQMDGILKERYAEIDKALGDKLSEIDKRYAGYSDEISEYRKNGTAKESLGVIADVLIKNAAMKDDYDFEALPWMSKERYEDEKVKENIPDDTRKDAPSFMHKDAFGNADDKNEQFEDITVGEGTNDTEIYGELADEVAGALAGKVDSGKSKLADAIGKIIAESKGNPPDIMQVLYRIAEILKVSGANHGDKS